ncbi:hypothetical protein IMZ48_24500 [Candidatus Bathyarchaeota archaeon]|nr:hypothetical protein [Candidatus Bathyarchaeota archaeon]
MAYGVGDGECRVQLDDGEIRAEMRSPPRAAAVYGRSHARITSPWRRIAEMAAEADGFHLALEGSDLVVFV